MQTIVIRSARPADTADVVRLSVLDEARIPAGDLLVAIADGELVAAVSVDTGDAIADPFRPSAAAVELLRAQARRVRPQHVKRPLAERLLPRPLARTA